MEYYPNLREKIAKDRILYPKLVTTFEGWLVKYSDYDLKEKESRRCKNKLIYHLDNEQDYKNCILDFISGMSDTFAIDTFNEVITFYFSDHICCTLP